MSKITAHKKFRNQREELARELIKQGKSETDIARICNMTECEVLHMKLEMKRGAV